MPTSTPGPSTVFIPDHAASGKLVVDFSRNPKDFALAQWAQYVPVKKTEGRYVEMTVEMAGRILNTNLADFYWADGADSPKGFGNLEYFEWKSYLARRLAFPFLMGELAAEQASWDVLASHSRYSAQRAMTARTQKAVTIATTAGSYPSGHTSSVAAIAGVTGTWDLSTTARMDIKRSFDHAAEQINKSTLGAVKPEDLMVVISPGCARKMATSQEIIDYLKQSYAAEKVVKEGIGRANRFGMPDTYHGYKVVIEDAVKVTSQKGATKATSYVLTDSTPFMCARVGGLEGVEGAPSFSTITAFLYEEMTVESKHDRDERRHLGRVVENYDVVLTAGISGFLYTSAVT